MPSWASWQCWAKEVGRLGLGGEEKASGPEGGGWATAASWASAWAMRQLGKEEVGRWACGGERKSGDGKWAGWAKMGRKRKMIFPFITQGNLRGIQRNLREI